MKTTYPFFYLFISIIFFTGCSKEKDASVWINFINTSDNKITQAKTDELELGVIAGNAQTGYRKIEEMSKNTSAPVISFYGNVNGQFIESIPLRCGNGTNSLPPGKYDVLVETLNSGSVVYFNLTFR